VVIVIDGRQVVTVAVIRAAAIAGGVVVRSAHRVPPLNRTILLVLDLALLGQVHVSLLVLGQTGGTQCLAAGNAHRHRRSSYSARYSPRRSSASGGGRLCRHVSGGVVPAIEAGTPK